MGLRIIRPVKPPSLSESQRSEFLEEGERRWSSSTGEDSEELRAEFRGKFQVMKSRKISAETISEMARGVEEKIKAEQNDAAGICGKVDIATLLELL